MADGTLFPFEFLVAATPRALGASAESRQRWRRLLRDAARNRVAELVEFSWLDARSLALTIFYFPTAPMEGDVDNIIKPIMDALIGVVYPDDGVVERVLVQKFEPDIDWSLKQPTDMLATALDMEPPVVYIRVDDDLSWRQN